jgi:predicted DsbA family dithiol-disulfide isomerase
MSARFVAVRGQAGRIALRGADHPFDQIDAADFLGNTVFHLQACIDFQEVELRLLLDAGGAEGIDFDFDAITRTPNSLNSHRLVRFAGTQGLAAATVEAILRAYFERGEDIGSTSVLADIASAVGLPGNAVDVFLNSGDGRGDVFMENAQTHRLSINGVPCFVFDGAYGIAGAQDPDILVRMIDLVTEGRLEAPISRSPVTVLGRPIGEGR